MQLSQGNSIHRIILRSTMEKIQSLKNNSNAMEDSNIAAKKSKNRFLFEMQNEMFKLIGNILCFQMWKILYRRHEGKEEEFE